MCNRLPEIYKNGDAGIFPVYYSLNIAAAFLLFFIVFGQIAYINTFSGVFLFCFCTIHWDSIPSLEIFES